MRPKPQILLAERQDDVISLQQLLELEFSRGQVRGATGRWLHPVYRGVYTLGTRRVTDRGRCMAALLSLGHGAVLSHRSAAAIWRIVRSFPGEPEVTMAESRAQRDGIRLFFRPLPANELATSGAIRLTNVSRTILDLAATRPRREVEAATSEAEYLGVWDPFSLPAFIESHARWKGISVLKAMLAEGAITITKSELERRFLAFLRKRRLPLPETNSRMTIPGRRIEPDCVWRNERLIVELDGRAAHQTTGRFHSDRLRDRKLDIAGWTVWRVTARHLNDELERDLRTRLA
jgi:very-short-patch-repair endonuclease